MALVASPALATLSFHDDFESGSMSNWTPVAGSAGGLSITGPDQWKSIDPGPWGVNPGYSARQSDIVGTGKGNASYHDFGAQSGTVKVEAYIFEDLTTSANPIQGAIQLTGTGSGAPSYGNDYMQLGILQWSGQNAKYAFRTHHGGFVVTSVDRKKGWTKLGIEADAGVGSEVRFYIDDALVGTSLRDATDLQYMILGVNADNYENFWYDGVNITPEPASLLMLALGGGVLLRRRAA
jgi:hypothetical protein